MEPTTHANTLRETVRQRYAERALRVVASDPGGCCSGSGCGDPDFAGSTGRCLLVTGAEGLTPA